MSGFSFTLEASDGMARRGRLATAHGAVETPAFMPVGTAGAVKAMSVDQVLSTGTEIVLANTYHLMLRPGPERVERLGGARRMMGWEGPLLTDSGGFQVMSLGHLREIDADGATFRSHVDGTVHRLTPEHSTRIQRMLDATITMAFDECTPFPASEEAAAASMRLSMDWAERCRAAFEPRPGYGQFGIVQGSVYPGLRAESAARLEAVGFEGYAIGGLAVGEGREAMLAAVDATAPLLPQGMPRYLMGVGKPDDIIESIARGIDMFDCVLPTRSGRTGRAFTRRGAVNIRNARHADDPRPLDEECPCQACRRHGRAYLHHLFKADEMLGPMLLTHHNIQYYQDLVRGARSAIAEGGFGEFREGFRRLQAAGDIDAL